MSADLDAIAEALKELRFADDYINGAHDICDLCEALVPAEEALERLRAEET